MVRASKDVLQILLGIALSLIVVLPLFAQDPEATPTGQEKDSNELESAHVPLAFPDEKLNAPSGDLSATQILASCKKYLAPGTEIQDLRWRATHKHYRKNNNLYFIEDFEAFIDEGEDQPRVRIDYLNYIDTESNRDYFIDYREIYGEDGPFKYREGSIIRLPDAVNETGHHTLKVYLMMLAPFCSLLNTATPEYEGISTWTEKTDDAEETYNCHKIVLVFDDPRIHIKEEKVALYIDTGNYDLRRLVYRPGSDREKFVKRLRVIDYLHRVKVGSVLLPDEIVSFDYWHFEKQVTHKYTFDKLALNTGLEGITFGMTDQIPRPRVLRK